MMTRKDYVKVADILAGYHQAMIDNFWWEDLVNDFLLKHVRREYKMILDTGTLIGITIALFSSLFVMGVFWKQNIAQQKEIRRLQIALRSERLKK